MLPSVRKWSKLDISVKYNNLYNKIAKNILLLRKFQPNLINNLIGYKKVEINEKKCILSTDIFVHCFYK